ncbi:hypothetical protein ACFX2B_031532 [Malus domestica]
MYYLSGLAKARILLFSTPHFVIAAAVAVADADDDAAAAASVAAECIVQCYETNKNNTVSASQFHSHKDQEPEVTRNPISKKT